MKIVLLNGPPRVGKDTIGSALVSLAPYCTETAKFAAELKDAVHRLYGLNVPTDFFESRKDVPCEELLGAIPRQLYIALSERYFKPMHGPDIFGKLLVRTLQGMERCGTKLVVVTDSGFAEEARAVMAVYPETFLVRLTRNGTSFEGDSRTYFDMENVPTWIFSNNSAMAPNSIAESILRHVE